MFYDKDCQSRQDKRDYEKFRQETIQTMGYDPSDSDIPVAGVMYLRGNQISLSISSSVSIINIFT